MSEMAIREAMDAANIFMQNDEQRLAYINREMAIMDYKSDMEGSREAGREEGREEGKIEMALEMLKDKVDFDKIVKYSQLSREKILELAKQRKII